MSNIFNAKPFLKWAGGKTQLIAEIEKRLPSEIYKNSFTYVEPFIGSGAVLFWMLNNFPNIEKAVINDVNADLINTYKTIRSTPNELIEVLYQFQLEFHSLESNEEEKKKYYYAKREQYNTRESDSIIQAGLFIFLNRTCFNGLYRVNRKNLFNVPMGSYKTPMICDKKNIYNGSKALQKVEILHGDFEQTIKFAGSKSFFYFDPPYKPISKTSSFNSYAEGEFDDNEQIRLRDFCKRIHLLKSKWILSNSDVGEDSFFDNIYTDFVIERVKAKRAINSNSSKRGELNEIIVTDYYAESLNLFSL